MPLFPHPGIYVSTQWLVDATGAHRTTVERWKRTQRLPRAVSTLVRLHLGGELELVNPRWRGYTIDREGLLHTPGGVIVPPGHIEAIPYRIAQIRALERDLAATRARLREVEDAGVFRRFFKRA